MATQSGGQDGSRPSGGGGGGSDRYANRSYQPYVFRPNFMKNQDGEKKQYGRKVFNINIFCKNQIGGHNLKTNFFLL